MSVWIREGDVLRALRDTPASPSSIPGSPATAVSLDVYDIGSQSPMDFDNVIANCMQSVHAEEVFESHLPEDSYAPYTLAVENTRSRENSPCDHGRVSLRPTNEDSSNVGLYPVDSARADCEEPAWWKRTRHDVALHGTF